MIYSFVFCKKIKANIEAILQKTLGQCLERIFFMLHDCKQDITFLGQWTILSGQNGVILPAQVANHGKGCE